MPPDTTQKHSWQQLALYLIPVLLLSNVYLLVRSFDQAPAENTPIATIDVMYLVSQLTEVGDSPETIVAATAAVRQAGERLRDNGFIVLHSNATFKAPVALEVTLDHVKPFFTPPEPRKEESVDSRLNNAFQNYEARGKAQ